MSFTGSYSVYVDKNGEFKIPKNLQHLLTDGAEFEVFYLIDHKNDNGEPIWLLSYAFDRPNYPEYEKPISSGKVTEDKKLRVPEEYRDLMKGKCLLFGVLNSLELTIFSIEDFLSDDEIKNIPDLQLLIT